MSVRTVWEGQLIVGDLTINTAAVAGHASSERRKQKVETEKRNLATGNPTETMDIDRKTKQPVERSASCVNVGEATKDERVVTEAMSERLGALLPNQIEILGTVGQSPVKSSRMMTALHYLIPSATAADRNRYGALCAELDDTTLLGVAGWNGTQYPVAVSAVRGVLCCQRLVWPENFREPEDLGAIHGNDSNQARTQVRTVLASLNPVPLDVDHVTGDFRTRALRLLSAQAPSLSQLVEAYLASQPRVVHHVGSVESTSQSTTSETP